MLTNALPPMAAGSPHTARSPLNATSVPSDWKVGEEPLEQRSFICA